MNSEASDALRRRTIDPSRAAGVTPVVFDDAPRRGVHALQIRNAAGLELTLVADRGLDASELRYRGMPLTWYGPGNAAPAGTVDPSEDAFDRSFFGGLVTTCGMDAYGSPGTDAYGTWPQHGHYNRLGARDVRWEMRLDADVPTIVVHGTVAEYAMFAGAFRIERTWTIGLFANTVAMHDVVTNDGGAARPHLVLYHCNIGHPFLAADTAWTVDAEPAQPRDARAAAGLAQWNRGGDPEPDFTEQVYVHVPRAATNGWATAAASNERLRTRLRVAFRPEQLPGLFSWRMLGFGTYVMAIEPANCTIVQGRIAAAQAGVLPMLAPGASRTYELRFAVDDL
jgi:hypothetical protein